jgi:hypothetical protein
MPAPCLSLPLLPRRFKKQRSEEKSATGGIATARVRGASPDEFDHDLSSRIGVLIAVAKYGLGTWPGSVRAQSLVFLAVTAGCLFLITVLPGMPGIAAGLLLAGVCQSGVMVTRSLSLRERRPQHAHAAAYSVMYAVGGLGYSLAASRSALALDLASPSVAILGGVAITLLITAISAMAERHTVGIAICPPQ